MYQEASPIMHVSAGDPPAFLYYLESDRKIPDSAPAGAGIHSPKFGEALKKRLDPLKIECIITNRADYAKKGGDVNDDMVKFFQKYFGTNKTAEAPAKPKL